MDEFTDEYIETLETTDIIEGFPGVQTDYFDGFNIGAGGRLGIRVKLNKEQKYWFMEYLFCGAMRRMSLGRYPKTSLEQARKLAIARLLEFN